MKKIPAKYRMIVFILLMTVFIGLIMSFIMTVMAQGLSSTFISTWLSRFAQTWIIVLPTVLVVMPIVNFITDKIVENEE